LPGVGFGDLLEDCVALGMERERSKTRAMGSWMRVSSSRVIMVERRAQRTRRTQRYTEGKLSQHICNGDIFAAFIRLV
jgi:hypothetical protein